jgi:alpha-tubulin suppressor-like RCC1 family protein
MSLLGTNKLQVLENGEVMMWGHGSQGQIGNNTPLVRVSPRVIKSLSNEGHTFHTSLSDLFQQMFPSNPWNVPKSISYNT